MIINKIYETQNLLSLWLVSFLIGLRTYQHPCTESKAHNLQPYVSPTYVLCKFMFFYPDLMMILTGGLKLVAK
jgi:hypothetical protein